MNNSNENCLRIQQLTNWEEQTVEKEVEIYNQSKKVIEKLKIQIKFTQDCQIISSYDGEILRVVQSQNILEKPDMFNNIDQIHNLSWQGQYDKNKKKDGKWIAFWNNELLRNVGGQSQIIIYILYYKNGQKQGLWKDLFQHYWRYAQIFEIGEYCDDFRIGRWNYIQKDVKNGGGYYNKVGQKQGKWIALDEGYYSCKKVIHYGQYDKDMKIGRWDILYDKYGNGNYQQIKGKNIQIHESGGGQYDLEGYQKKKGKWIELEKDFKDEKQVTYNGEYNMNNMKVGRWDIMYRDVFEKEYKQIGGGSYDQEGNLRKIGKWIELDEGFRDNQQVIWIGEYNMDNVKVGRWDIMYRKYDEEEQKQIGGGSYDQEGHQKKIGKWVELDEGFKLDKQVTFNGEYKENGMKVGIWDIMYCRWNEEEYKQIGGGLYDQVGHQKKIGKWVELDEGFFYHFEVLFNGEYNINSKKVGRWDIMYRKYDEKEFIQIMGIYIVVVDHMIKKEIKEKQENGCNWMKIIKQLVVMITI